MTGKSPVLDGGKGQSLDELSSGELRALRRYYKRRMLRFEGRVDAIEMELEDREKTREGATI